MNFEFSYDYKVLRTGCCRVPVEIDINILKRGWSREWWRCSGCKQLGPHAYDVIGRDEYSNLFDLMQP